jgi:hypothetical protein
LQNCFKYIFLVVLSLNFDVNYNVFFVVMIFEL